jgi:hypothetical protein
MYLQYLGIHVGSRYSTQIAPSNCPDPCTALYPPIVVPVQNQNPAVVALVYLWVRLVKLPTTCKHVCAGCVATRLA